MATANVLAQAFITEEERVRAENRERARRQGNRFIHIQYVGHMEPAPRIHRIEDIIAYEATDPENPRKTILKTRRGTNVLDWDFNPSSGIWECWIYDCEYNRFFLRSHLNDMEGNPCIKIVDPEIAAEIESLIGVPYNVEKTHAERLRQEINEKQRQLEDIEKSELEKKEAKEKAVKNIATNNSANEEHLKSTSGRRKPAGPKYG